MDIEITGTYPIIIDGQEIGSVSVAREGLFWVFAARSEMLDDILRLSVFGDGAEGYLGVMIPEAGGLMLKKKLSRSGINGFPSTIEYAGRSGEGYAAPVISVPEEAATQASADVSIPAAEAVQASVDDVPAAAAEAAADVAVPAAETAQAAPDDAPQAAAEILEDIAVPAAEAVPAPDEVAPELAPETEQNALPQTEGTEKAEPQEHYFPVETDDEAAPPPAENTKKTPAKKAPKETPAKETPAKEHYYPVDAEDESVPAIDSSEVMSKKITPQESVMPPPDGVQRKAVKIQSDLNWRPCALPCSIFSDVAVKRALGEMKGAMITTEGNYTLLAVPLSLAHEIEQPSVRYFNKTTEIDGVTYVVCKIKDGKPYGALR